MCVAGPPAVFDLIVLDSVDSTNEEVKRRAARGAPEGTLVWAKRQTAGRGRRRRRWASPRGNLYCSLLLRPRCPPAEATRLGFIAGIAVAEAVTEALPHGKKVACKWPNDIFIGRRKVAGILLESMASARGDVEWVVLGIGLNIAWHPEASDLDYFATSLAAEGAAEATPALLVGSIARKFWNWLTIWSNEGFAPLRLAWLDWALGLHEPIVVRLDNETLEGIFVDLDGSGALVLGGTDGERLIAAGDVFPVGS